MRLLLAVISLLLPTTPVFCADAAEQQALELVKKLRGKIERDKDIDGTPVVKVNLAGKRIADDGLKELTAFKDLRELSHEGTPVTDEGLKALPAFELLESLDLKRTRVTDEGLRELRRIEQLLSLGSMTQLQELDILGTNVTNAGLKHLVTLKRLQKLIVWSQENKLTNTGIADLEKALPNCDIVDAGRLPSPLP